MTPTIRKLRGRPPKVILPKPKPKMDIPPHWLSTAPAIIDRPVPLVELVSDLNDGTIGVIAIRNQIDASEFLDLMHVYPDMQLRQPALARAALDRLAGWSRVRGYTLHRNSLRAVYRRDGTDGKPQIVDDPTHGARWLEREKEWMRRKTFGGFIMRVRFRDNLRGATIMHLRKQRLGYLCHTTDSRGKVIHPRSFNEMIEIQSAAVRESADVVRVLRELWREYTLSLESPEDAEQRLERERARLKDEQMEYLLNMRKTRSAAREKEISRMLALGEAALDRPCPHLGGKFCNQLSGKEFLTEVLLQRDSSIRNLRLDVTAALRRMPGWKRMPHAMPHRGETQFVFRREGTDGKPTDFLPRSPLAGEAPVVKTRRRLA